MNQSQLKLVRYAAWALLEGESNSVQFIIFPERGGKPLKSTTVDQLKYVTETTWNKIVELHGKQDSIQKPPQFVVEQAHDEDSTFITAVPVKKEKGNEYVEVTSFGVTAPFFRKAELHHYEGEYYQAIIDWILLKYIKAHFTSLEVSWAVKGKTEGYTQDKSYEQCISVVTAVFLHAGEVKTRSKIVTEDVQTDISGANAQVDKCCLVNHGSISNVIVDLKDAIDKYYTNGKQEAEKGAKALSDGNEESDALFDKFNVTPVSELGEWAKNTFNI